MTFDIGIPTLHLISKFILCVFQIYSNIRLLFFSLVCNQSNNLKSDGLSLYYFLMYFFSQIHKMWTYDNKMIQIFDVKSVTTITIPFISRYSVSTITTTLYSKAMRRYSIFCKNTSKIISKYIKIMLIFECCFKLSIFMQNWAAFQRRIPFLKKPYTTRCLNTYGNIFKIFTFWLIKTSENPYISINDLTFEPQFM